MDNIQRSPNYRLYLRRAFENLEEKKYSVAIDWLSSLLKMDPNNPDAWFWKGYALKELGQKERAKKAYEIAIEEYSKRGFKVNLTFDNQLVDKTLHKAAIQAISAALERDSSNLDLMAKKGNVLLNLGKKKEALKIFDTVLKTNPTNAPALSGKGKILSEMEHYEPWTEDLNWINFLLDKDPSNAVALFYKGIILLKKHDPIKATWFFQEAIRHDPENANIWVGLGDAHLALENPREAHEAYKKALIQDPQNKKAVLGRALAEVQLRPGNNNRDILEIYNTILENQPGNFDILSRKSKLQFELNNHDDALKTLETILKERPEDTDAISLKAKILFERGELPRTLLLFNKILQKDPDNLKILFKKGYCLFLKQEYTDALEAFNKIIGFAPHQTAPLYYCGLCQEKLDNLTGAKTVFEKITALDPDNYHMLIYQGLAFCKLGLLDRACKNYHEVLDSDFNKNSLEKTEFLQLKNAIRFARNINRQSRVKPNQKDDSIDFSSSGNHVLEVMSSFGSMKLDRFNLALQVLVAKNIPENQPDVYRNIRNSFIRALQSLGHCEFDFSRREVHVHPPSLLLLPSSTKKKTVLVGGRTWDQIKRIHDYVNESGGDGKFSYLENSIPITYRDPCAPVVHLPSTVIISGKSSDFFSGIAKEFSLGLELKNPACNILTDFSISIDDYRNTLVPSFNEEINWERLIFEPCKLAFSRYGEISKENCTLVSCLNPRDQQLSHIYWDHGKGSIVERDWGRYLSLQDAGAKVFIYDPGEKLLGVPASCPLPLLLSRAATLCSGRLPFQITCKDPPEGVHENVIQLNVYHEVPPEIARKIAEKVGQELIQGKNLI